MTVMELHKVLGERIETTLRQDLSPEERQTENAQTALIIGVANQMIKADDLILRHEQLLAKCKNLRKSRMDEIIG